MKKPKVLQVVAWGAVPIAFAIFIASSYSFALRSKTLPFLGDNELKWWLAFLVALATGGICLAIVNWRDKFWRFVGPIAYLLTMSAVLLVTHFVLACAHGDCL